jgi:multiple sugar transport system permease protein
VSGATTQTVALPRRRHRWTRLQLAGLAMAAPAILYIVVFSLFPVLYGLRISFTQYNPLRRGGPKWIGLDNYTGLLHSAEFGRSLLVTGQFVLMVLPATVVIATGLAVLVNRPFRGIGIVRSALYLPNIVSLTAVSMIWLWMYSRNGLFNEVLSAVGLPAQDLLHNENTALAAAAAMRVWKALGSNMVLILAGMQGIPNERYEAATVDGATAWQRFVYVTLPGLRPTLVFVVAMDIIYLAQSFAEIYVLTQGGPLGSTTTVNYLIYTTAFQYNQFGSASAMAFVLFAFVAGFSLLATRGITGRRG